MFKLYDKQGKAHTVRYLIDKNEALASGEYFEVNPTKKREDLSDAEEAIVSAQENPVEDQVSPSRRARRVIEESSGGNK